MEQMTENNDKKAEINIHQDNCDERYKIYYSNMLYLRYIP